MNINRAFRPTPHGPRRGRPGLTDVFCLHYTDPVSATEILSPVGGSMRSCSGVSLAAVAMLAFGCVVSSTGCAKVGELKSMKAFKSANQAYQQQDYKKAAQLYEAAIQAAPDTRPAQQSYFFLGNSYDNLYKPSRKGEQDNDELLNKAVEALEERASKEPNNPEAFYTISTYYWDKAYRDFKLKENEKRDYVQKGVEAVDHALQIKADYMEALVYKNLLLRLQANLEKDTTKQQMLIKEADKLRDRAQELRKQKAAGTTP